jgi:hypothetical protein
MSFEHEDWDADCDGGLLPASNIKDCYVCIRCGYDSRGVKASTEKMENQND